MSVRIDPQIISQNGKPVFAVIPWNEYQALIHKQIEPDESDVWFPISLGKAGKW